VTHTKHLSPWAAAAAKVFIASLLAAFVMLAAGRAHADPTTANAANATQGSASGASASALSGDAQALFADANKRYFSGDWTGAAQAYAAIIERFQVEDATLYHNLGNACFRSGAYGSAILYYRRAQKLEPDAKLAESLDRNLDAARRTLQARYRSSANTSMVYADPSGVVYQVTHLVGETTLAVGFGALWFGLFGLLMLRRLRPSVRWPGRVAVPVGLLVAVAGVLVWGRIATDADQRVGVVVSAEAMLRDGKHEVAQGKSLAEGLEVRILDGDNAWTQVELADGQRGWVESKSVKQI